MKHRSKSLTIMLAISIALLTSISMTMNASCRDEPPPIDNSRVPVPSVPESFSIAYVDHSYDVPTTTYTTTDYYTGEVTTHTNWGYHVKNFTIDVTIKNQAFPAVIDGNVSCMKYAISSKGAYFPEFRWWTMHYAQPNSEYTTISLSTDSITRGGTVDIRVAAVLGYEFQGWDFLYPVTNFAYKMSNWTEAKSITIPKEGSTQPTPTTPEFPTTTLVLPLLAIPFAVAVIQKKKHQPKPAVYNS